MLGVRSAGKQMYFRNIGRIDTSYLEVPTKNKQLKHVSSRASQTGQEKQLWLQMIQAWKLWNEGNQTEPRNTS